MAPDFISIDGKEISRIDLSLNGKELAFEKKESLSVENKSDEEKSSSEGSSAKTQKSWKWIMKKGPEHLKVKDKMVDEMISGLNGFSAEEAVSPTTPADYGLDTPEYTLHFVSPDEEKNVTIVGHNDGTDAYISADNLQSVFKVRSWNFDSSIPQNIKTL